MNPIRQQGGRVRAAGALATLLAAVLAGCGSQNANAEPSTDGSNPSAGGAAQEDETPPTVHKVEVVKSYAHDPKAYTQGLLFADGRLLESTGRYGTSGIREVRLETGQVIRTKSIAYQFFGEGLALHDGELFFLTWKAGKVFVYDRHSFHLKREHVLEGEGWGIVSSGEHLIVSDGTSTLRYFDPKTFEEVRRVEVKSEGRPLTHINELEMVEGELLANVWKSDYIARIDPKTGRLKGWLDLTGIVDFPPIRDSDAVLNGIAYDADKKRLFVTGKLWPKLYEIRAQTDEEAGG